MTTTAKTVNITSATLADVPAIRRVAELTWPDTFGNILSPEELATALETSYSAEHLAQRIASGQERFFILKENAEVVAYASISTNTEALTKLSRDAQKSVKLEKLYCLPSCHGKGFGKRLLHHVETIAKADGFVTLHLLVNRANPAVLFYQRQGFTIAGEQNEMYEGIYRTDFVMMKDLEN